MQIHLQNPTNIINDDNEGEIPAWICPRCNEAKRLEEFGFRKRDDLYPDENVDVWMKQSWCRACR